MYARGQGRSANAGKAGGSGGKRGSRGLEGLRDGDRERGCK